MGRAAHGARRIGAIRIGVLALRLPIYRVELLGRPVELITRPTFGNAARVLAIVPAAADDELELEASTRALLETALPEAELNELALELLAARDDEALENFLGKVFRSVKRAVGGAAKGVSRMVAAVDRRIGKAIDTVNKFVPVKSIINLTPYGMTRNLVSSAGRVLGGENVFKVAGQFVRSGIKDIGEAAQLASMVTSFVPGVGTGVAAALGAASALAAGKPITEAVLSAASAAIPGGAIARAAFDTATGLIKGQSLGEAALGAVRNRIPGGAGAGRLLPPSPFAASALSFASKVASGANLQDAALSAAGKAALSRITPKRELEWELPGPTRLLLAS
ncbi:MAG: hypothetical protein E6J91_20760 [Deltaproteobacteria bacterium]|nr:MAG: hypothetical protein E6J91_20760 [Deltaproteobacteria bacterium]